MARIPGVLKITINDEDHPDDMDKWTVEEVERLTELPADAPFVICRPFTVPMWMPDNKLGRCAGCGCPIQFRPDNTIEPKICDGCAREWIPNHARAS